MQLFSADAKIFKKKKLDYFFAPENMKKTPAKVAHNRPHENQSKLLGYQGWVEILMITLVYSKRVSVRNNLLHSVHQY